MSALNADGGLEYLDYIFHSIFVIFFKTLDSNDFPRTGYFKMSFSDQSAHPTHVPMHMHVPSNYTTVMFTQFPLAYPSFHTLRYSC